MDIQEYLFKAKVTFISLDELRALVFRFIKDEISLEYAEKYLYDGKTEMTKVRSAGIIRKVGSTNEIEMLENDLSDFVGKLVESGLVKVEERELYF
jgi:hypothetical protein